MKKTILRPNGSLRSFTVNEEPSRTQQQFKDQTNVNNIMKKYLKTGTITHLNTSSGQYGDFSTLTDYQKSLQTVIDANNSFNQLSSEIRKKFGNNPQLLINFLADPKNREEAIDLGLITKPPQPDTQSLILNELKNQNKNNAKNDDSNDDKRENKKPKN